MKAEIVKEFSFEAAHRLPGVGPDHKCSRLHGHLFKVEVAIAGEVDPELGWVMDFGDLARTAGRIISSLDHRVLNDIPGLENPTSENLSKYLFDRIATGIPDITALTIHESPYSRCTYRPVVTEQSGTPAGDFRITTTEAVFSSAHFLVFPPADREPIHGHDYRVTVTGASSRPAPGARETLNNLMCEAIAPLEHKLLLAANPAVGKMVNEGGSIRIDVKGIQLVFPTTDCYIMEGVANTTTELIAFDIAGKIARDVASSLAGFVEIEVEIQEGLDTRAKAVAKV